MAWITVPFEHDVYALRGRSRTHQWFRVREGVEVEVPELSASHATTMAGFDFGEAMMPYSQVFAGRAMVSVGHYPDDWDDERRKLLGRIGLTRDNAQTWSPAFASQTFADIRPSPFPLTRHDTDRWAWTQDQHKRFVLGMGGLRDIRVERRDAARLEAIERAGTLAFVDGLLYVARHDVVGVRVREGWKLRAVDIFDRHAALGMLPAQTLDVASCERLVKEGLCEDMTFGEVDLVTNLRSRIDPRELRLARTIATMRELVLNQNNRVLTVRHTFHEALRGELDEPLFATGTALRDWLTRRPDIDHCVAMSQALLGTATALRTLPDEAFAWSRKRVEDLASTLEAPCVAITPTSEIPAHAGP